MFLRQFPEPALGHASYLLGDESTGLALVLDPRRDTDDYFAVAREQGFHIAYAVDTHGHNDYLSGLMELAARSGATVLGYADADLGYDHRAVKDREVLEIGDLGVEVLHTPGHTPEHISLLIHDRAVGDEPAVLLSGGALLVGDLARPDLLGGNDAARAAAETFIETLRTTILALPDSVEVFPTHVAGSLCGSNIGSRLSTTIGYERRTQDALRRLGGDADATDVIRLDDLPAVPPYWRRMRSKNLSGAPLLGTWREPPALSPEAFARAMDTGAVVLDARQPEAFGGAHIPGALNAGLGNSFPTWAGTVLDADAQILLVLDDPADLPVATWHLLRIGYQQPAGWLSGGMFAWRTQGRPLQGLPQVPVSELADALERSELTVLDVRQPAEWTDGHIAGATFISGAEVPARLDEVPVGPLAVMCGSGYRSSVVASVLQAAGRTDIVSILGGMAAWKAADLPVTDGG